MKRNICLIVLAILPLFMQAQQPSVKDEVRQYRYGKVRTQNKILDDLSGIWVLDRTEQTISASKGEAYNFGVTSSGNIGFVLNF